MTSPLPDSSKTTTSVCPHPEAVGKRWGDPISKERQAELQAILDTWNASGADHGNRKGPFHFHSPSDEEGARLRLTGADVFWLAKQSGRDKIGRVPNLHLEGADLREAHLEGAHLILGHLEGAHLRSAHLEGAHLFQLQLEKANLREAHLEGTQISEAYLQGSNLRAAHLEEANISRSHLEGANLYQAHVEGANLALVFFDSGTTLRDIALVDKVHGGPTLVDIRWGDANLAVVRWSVSRRRFLRKRMRAITLGDEQEAWKRKDKNRKRKRRVMRLAEFERAVRVNRQLSTALRNQGLTADADRFAYKAQVLERQVFWREGRWASAVGSWFLDLISGYGFKPSRAFIAYVFVIVGFMGLYLLNSQLATPHLTWDEALVLSMSSFHGRGFFNNEITLGDTYTRLASAEAFIGLFIEITFIATFTQRFFAR